MLLLSGAAAGQIGPDVIAGDITGPSLWGTLNGMSAYSIGTSSCNVGDEDLLWDDETGDGTPANLHPLMSQNMFRLKNGRFEQIGQSWLKHAFFALNFNGLCSNSCVPSSLGGSALGPGCWDPYSSSLNGSQGGLGPKFEVNPATGAYPWPYTGDGQTGNVLYKRIQVLNSDLDPALNPGALYFGEGQYVTPDDAAAGNQNNNATYRQMSVGSFSGGWQVNFTGSTQRGKPGIQAWQDNDPAVTMVAVDVPGDGRFWVAYKVSLNNDGVTYHYEYAIQNLNSDRAAGGFSIPVGNGVTLTNVGFHDVDYHSGEPFDNTDWSSTETGTSIDWNSPNPFAVDPFSNALRWGTLYNFRFDADTPPEAVTATLDLFKPGTPSTMSIPVMGPSAAFVCLADVNGDGMLDSSDFTSWIKAFNTNDPAADQNGDGQITPADFNAWVVNFNAGC